MKEENKIIRKFGLSTFAVKNRTTIILLTLLILITGIGAYNAMPKENFPEISIPTIYVGMTYAGNSPLDMENLITRHIEKEINTITGVAKIKSSIIQDYSTTIVEFDFDKDVTDALVKVKDAVDKVRNDLPNDMDVEPNIFEMDFTAIPVINLNISGDRYTLEQLNDYAEILEDRIETLSQISKVEIRGAVQKEIKIEVDKLKMEGLEISFRDIEDAIGYENKTISAGDLLIGENRRSIRIVGQFQEPKEGSLDPTIEEQIGDIIIKNQYQQTVKLRDIAEIKFEAKETESYARIFGKPVISLDIMKRGGENLLDAVAEIKKIVNKSRAEFPKDLDLTITNDTSKQTELMLSNLQNSIISGVLLVVLVLLFFLGLRNALFVGIAIPLSMVMSFLILNAMGITLNMMVLFSLVLALGMLVDNGIVVVENIYRMMEEGKDIVTASIEGVGEVAVPIIASTATTLAAFVPLIFWSGIMGEFMKYLPITLIIVLGSSLFVALLINPVLTSFFMKIQDLKGKRKGQSKWFWIITIVLLAIFIPFSYINFKAGKFDNVLIANLILVFLFITLINIFILEPLSKFFQNKVLVILENGYSKFIAFALKGWKTIAGFQTRNPVHKAHEHLQRVALEVCDALLINPLLGWKKAGDFSERAVIDGYQTMINEYYAGLNIYFKPLRTPMRYAGPREAIFHAIIRRNLGCTHFIIGRDHAGVGEYYGKYEAQELARKIISKHDLGIELLLLSEPYYCKKCEQIVSDKTCNHSNEYIQKISGTQIRAMLADGKRPSNIFMRPEVADSIIKLEDNKFIKG